MQEEDLEDASGEGEQECWFGEGGCLKSNEMESRSQRDCCLSPTRSRDKPGSKLDDNDDEDDDS